MLSAWESLLSRRGMLHVRLSTRDCRRQSLRLRVGIMEMSSNFRVKSFGRLQNGDQCSDPPQEKAGSLRVEERHHPLLFNFLHLSVRPPSLFFTLFLTPVVDLNATQYQRGWMVSLQDKNGRPRAQMNQCAPYYVNRTYTNTARTELHSMITFYHANTRGSRAAKLRIAHLRVPETFVIHVSCLIPCST